MTDDVTETGPKASEESGTAPVAAVSTATIRSTLLRYRVMAWVTGVWLLLLVAEMIAKYGFGNDDFGWIGIAHGWIYFVYLITAVDLGIKVRWPAGKIIVTAIAGTIPFLSFWVEHIRARDVKRQFGI